MYEVFHMNIVFAYEIKGTFGCGIIWVGLNPT